MNSVALIPAMTSNTTPSGEVSASSVYDANTTPAYGAFDKSTAKYWMPTTGDNKTDWIQYKFPKSVVVKKISFKRTGTFPTQSPKFKLQGSNNGSSWIDITSYATIPTELSGTVNITNSNSYIYYRISFNPTLNINDTSGKACGFDEIQMYGYVS